MKFKVQFLESTVYNKSFTITIESVSQNFGIYLLTHIQLFYLYLFHVYVYAYANSLNFLVRAYSESRPKKKLKSNHRIFYKQEIGKKCAQ